MDSTEQEDCERHETLLTVKENTAPRVSFAQDHRTDRPGMEESGWTKLYGRENEKERLIRRYEATMDPHPPEEHGFLVVTGGSGTSLVPSRPFRVVQSRVNAIKLILVRAYA